VDADSKRTEISALSRAELEEHALALRTVMSVAEAVHGSSDFDDLVDRAVDAIVTYTHFPSVGLFRVNRPAGCVELVAIRGFGPELEKSVRTLPLVGSLTGEAVRTGTIMTTHDIATDNRVDPGARRALDSEGFVEAASVPLLFRTEVIGTLNLLYRSVIDLSAHEREMLLAIGRTIAMAMHNRLAVAEREALERRLRRTEELENLSVFAGGLAHDFNNLLVGVICNIGLVKERLAEPKREGDPLTGELLDEAFHASERAAELVRQLLTLSKGGAPLTRPTNHIDAIVRDAALFALRGSEFRCVVDAQGEFGIIEIDPAQLCQVVENLVLNAAQASVPGQEIHVTLRGDVELPAEPPLPAGRHLRLEVRDEGAGIPKENLPRIFDPYFTTRSSGSGLGLASTYSIVRRHSGRIAVESVVGKGSTFTVDIPFRAATVPQSRASSSQVPIGARVLILDDDPRIRRVFRRVAERLQLVVDDAATSDEAVALFASALASETPYRCVVLDLTIVGGQGGVATLGRLRALDPDVRAIASSGYSADSALAEYQRLGFMGVLPKPYSARQLEAALAAALLA
jgi:signal transduction histidine kinase/CheY-like chemotaxis protein